MEDWRGRVPIVFGVELPIVRQRLAVIADHPQRLDEHAVDIGGKLGTDIREMTESSPKGRISVRDKFPPATAPAMAGTGRNLAQPSLAANSSFERNTRQSAGEIVGPVVIDAVELSHVARLLSILARLYARTD